VFLHTSRVFCFPPYFYHDAFMHHTMDVLDAPVGEWRYAVAWLPFIN